MQTRRFAIAFKDVKGQAVLTYDEQDRLITADISELYEYDNEKNRLWMWNWFPRKLGSLVEWAQMNDERIKIHAIFEDLSFDRFWNEYEYKIGEKPTAKKLWNSLSDQDKNKCLAAIPRYKYFLAHKPSIDKLYPQTFLKKRRFENEFKI